tara:strand:- start:123 stop:1109 length:987 start_codon:yes stop_codon:yes gene_type:complete
MTQSNDCFLFDFDTMFVILEKLIDLKKVGENNYVPPKFLNEITKLEATNKRLMKPFEDYLNKIYAKMLPIHLPVQIKMHGEDLYEVLYEYSSSLKHCTVPKIDINLIIPNATVAQKYWVPTWVNSYRLKMSTQAQYMCLSMRSSDSDLVVQKRQLWKVENIALSKTFKYLYGTSRRGKLYEVLLRRERDLDEIMTGSETDNIPDRVILHNMQLSHLPPSALVKAHFRHVCSSCNCSIGMYHSDSHEVAMRNLCSVCFKENTISMTHAYNLFKQQNYLSMATKSFELFEKKGHKVILRLNKQRMTRLTGIEWNALVKKRNFKYANQHIY